MTEIRKNPVPPRLRSFAKGQRSTQTRAEDLFWSQVRGGRFHGSKFKRQVPISPYIVDFLCISARLVIEFDGPPHDSSDQRVHDVRRDRYLSEQGFRVLRFTNDEFLGNPQQVMNRVFEAMEGAHGPSPDPASRGHPLPQRGEG